MFDGALTLNPPLALILPKIKSLDHMTGLQNKVSLVSLLSPSLTHQLLHIFTFSHVQTGTGDRCVIKPPQNRLTEKTEKTLSPV